MKRVIVALRSPRTFTGILNYARFVAACLAEHPELLPTTPPLAVFEAHVEAFSVTIVDALTRARGTSSAMRAARTVVGQDLMHLRSHVQVRADAVDGDARPLVEAAGMYVKATAGPSKVPFRAKPGSVSGCVHVYAKAENTRASYEFEYSFDEVNWLRLDPVMRADAVIRGLPVGIWVWFRYRPVTKAGVGPYSDPIKLLVR